MPERKSSTIIKDILTCIDHIQLYISGFGYEDFSRNFMAVEACLYNIQIIGEAVSQLRRRSERKRNTDSVTVNQRNAKQANS